ncbi:iron chaperone [Cellulomonas sp. URHB0016]
MARGDAPSTTVDEYLAALPLDSARALGEVRDTLVALVPDAGQVISYQVPCITYRGKPLVSISHARDHLSLHLQSPPLAQALSRVVTEGHWSGATLHFTADAPLSEATLRQVVQGRIAEVDAVLAARGR